MDFIPPELLPIMTSFGIDAGAVLAVVRMTDWVKEYLKGVSWDDPFKRLYVLIPFLCALFICFTTKGISNAAFICAMQYGAFATVVFRFWKHSVQGR